jgi:predicted PurR-regulated permease PerM
MEAKEHGMDTQWSTPTRYLVAVGLVLVGLYGLYLCSSILPVIIIGALVAFLVRPLIRLFHHRLKAPRGVAILVAYLIATIMILLAPLIFAAPIVNTVNFLANLDYQLLVDRSLNGLETSLSNLKTVDLRLLGFNIDMGNLVNPALAALQSTEPGVALQLPSLATLLNSLSSIFSTSYGLAVGVIGTVFSVSISFIFVIITAIYFSVDGGKLYAWFLRLTPPPYRLEMTTMLARLEVVWARFFVGQFILMVSMGLFIWIGATALGLSEAFPLAVIAALLEIVPVVGPILSIVPAVIVALLQGSPYLPVNSFVFALIVIGYYVLVNTVVNNFIYAKVLGEAVNLHPMIVFGGVIIGAAEWGILGALLAAPVIASMREITAYLYRKVFNQTPFPPVEAAGQSGWPDMGPLLTKFKGRFASIVREWNWPGQHSTGE